MFNKLRKLANDNKGSEVVEKILMVVTSIIIAGLGIGYLYKVINQAVKDANGETTDAIKDPNKVLDGNTQANA